MIRSGDVADAVVIGAGFYGCEVARFLKGLYPRVVLLEREGDLLGRASYANQARVHGGYHYPRSLTTGLRSQANYQAFMDRYRSCVSEGYSSIYAVARHRSHVTAAQFMKFCEVIGAPLRRLEEAETGLFDPQMVEAVFETREAVFDSNRLRQVLRAGLDADNVELHTGTEVAAVREAGGRLDVETRKGSGGETFAARRVFVCTYAGTAELLRYAGLPPLGLVHEQAELVLVDVPEELRTLGVTVMCGPFFSLTPHPATGKHCLSHVRYTPHACWKSADNGGPAEAFVSRSAAMLKDAERYLPAVKGCRVDRSLWETKVILPRNERNDGRPILFVRDHGFKNMHCIIGGKIDNLFDVLNELKQMHARGVL